MEAILNSIAEVVENLFNRNIINTIRFSAVLQDPNDGVQNICSASNSGKQQFTNSLEVAKFHFSLKIEFIILFGGSLSVFKVRHLFLVMIHWCENGEFVCGAQPVMSLQYFLYVRFSGDLDEPSALNDI